jgi:Restriction endonuclease
VSNRPGRTAEGDAQQQGRDANLKGKVVEQITAWTMSFDGLRVTHDLAFRTLDGSTRQIDVHVAVLVSGNSVGEWFVECKNYQGPVEIDLIDSYVGKLADIDVPTNRGIFVAVNGFTAEAQRRAKKAGITLFNLSGLRSDRLGAQFYRAVQSTVFVMPVWESFFVVTDPTDSTAGGAHPLYLDDGRQLYHFPDALWSGWMTEQIEAKLGKHVVAIDFPEGTHYFVHEDRYDIRHVGAVLNVSGHVFELEGRARAHSLTNVVTGTVDRHKTEATFGNQKEKYVLRAYSTEAALATALASDADLHIQSRVKIPRIRMRLVYWPPSERAARLMAEQMETSENVGVQRLTEGTFEDYEGTDVSSAFEPIMRHFFSSIDNNDPVPQPKITSTWVNGPLTQFQD